MTITYDEYKMIDNLNTTEWKLVMAELDEDQTKDYWWYKLLEDDQAAALR
tara:strand:+ start:858 stop:1007 length:150 start_codon:yes stop_codon:yes gene_type:complete